MSSVPDLPPNFNALPPPAFGLDFVLANDDGSVGAAEKSEEAAGVLYAWDELTEEPKN